MLKKFLSDQINRGAPTHHSFTCNELNQKVRLSKTVFGIFYFRFRFVFIKVYLFVQQNPWTL